MGDKRYYHSLKVSECAENLAEKYGVNKEKAKIAGIFHDSTKEFDNFKQMEIIDKFKIELSEFELNEKKLFHAVTGKAYVENIIGIKDQDILNAIRYHTTGRKGMSDLEKILYVADAISEDRTYKGVDKVRAQLSKGIDYAVLETLAYTLKSLVEDRKSVV